MEKLVATKNDKVGSMRDAKLRDWLNHRVSEGDLSHRELARRMGVSHTKVSRFLNGSDLAGFEFCIAISRYYRRDPLQILSMAGLVPPLANEKDSSIDEVIQIMRELGDYERQLVLAAVRGFRRGVERQEPIADRQDSHNQ